jgi:hypothetical protein
MLDRPLYERDLVHACFYTKLVDAKDESEWERLLSDFRTSHGEANYRGLLPVMAWASTFPQPQRDQTRERDKKIADTILGRFFPWFDPVDPPFLDAVDFRSQKELIERLAPFPSPSFDRAILGVFHRCLATRPPSIGDKLGRGDLARACVGRLGKKIPRQECLSFFEVQIQELLEAGSNPENKLFFLAIEQRIQLTRDLLASLNKGELSSEQEGKKGDIAHFKLACPPKPGPVLMEIVQLAESQEATHAKTTQTGPDRGHPTRLPSRPRRWLEHRPGLPQGRHRTHYLLPLEGSPGGPRIE